MINLEKMEKMEGLTFKNTLRLHNDSIMLFRARAYTSSYFLSVLAQEELGKAYILNDFVWSSHTEGRMPDKIERKWLELIYNHIFKQTYLFRLNFDGSQKSLKKWKQASLGAIELLKQEAAYVGFKRKSKGIDFGSRIVSPFKISERKTRKQIAMINDSLVDLVLGVVCEYYSWDTERTTKLMTKTLLKKLISRWQPSYKEQRKINSVRKKFNLKWLIN